MNNHKLPILLVDDEEQILFSYSLMLRSSGKENVLTVKDSRKVLPLLSSQDVSVVVLDLIMPHVSGAELLQEIKLEYPHLPVIVMTAMNELEKAVECMQAGAGDYLVKPVEESRFISSVQKALELRDLQNEITSLKKHLLTGELEHKEAFSAIISKSKKMKAIFQYIDSVAGSHNPVFITGETGSGKELIAKSVHLASGLGGKYVAVNIAGLDDTMLSDTLFGHKKGAYTGADKGRDGLIVQADGGTLLLDEIGDLSEASQVKLLRLLEEQVYYPLGADMPEKSNARIIACSNKDIEKQIEDGEFRKDLYYRLCTHHIQVPPLRERIEDIPLLLDHFLEQASNAIDKKKPTHPPELVTLLINYDYPGNIRELKAMVHDAVAQHKKGILSLESFKGFIKQKGTFSKKNQMASVSDADSLTEIFGHFPTLKESEDFLICQALKRAVGNQRVASSLLGISRQALNQRIKKKI